MKSIHVAKWNYLLFMVLITVGLSSVRAEDAQSGIRSARRNGGSGGGSRVGGRWAIYANKVINLVKANQSVFPEIDVKVLEEKFRDTDVKPTPEKLPLDDENKFAINNSVEGWIKIQILEFLLLQGNTTELLVGILHEYIGIMKIKTATGMNIDKNNYVSSRIGSLLGDLPHPLFKYSCSAVLELPRRPDPQYLDSRSHDILGKPLRIVGLGNTKGEAWQDINDTCDYFDCESIRMNDRVGHRDDMSDISGLIGPPATMHDACEPN